MTLQYCWKSFFKRDDTLLMLLFVYKLSDMLSFTLKNVVILVIFEIDSWVKSKMPICDIKHKSQGPGTLKETLFKVSKKNTRKHSSLYTFIITFSYSLA